MASGWANCRVIAASSPDDAEDWMSGVNVVVAPAVAMKAPDSMKIVELSWPVVAEVELKLTRRRFSQTG